MEHALRFGDVVEAADRLTLEEREELVEIVRKRVIAKRRGELLLEIEDAEHEYRQGQCGVMTADKAVARLFS
jgi:hypothetical protein